MKMILINEQKMKGYLYNFKSENKEQMTFQLNPKATFTSVYTCSVAFMQYAIMSMKHQSL